jgi:hypothetical protein
MAEKLQNNEFVAQETRGYIVCSHGQQRHDGQLFQFLADIYFMFAREDGNLAVIRLEWESDRPVPTPTPRPTPAEDPDALTVCIDIETPIIETGGENPKQWNIPGIMWSLPCGREMGSSICWDCDEDLAWRWLVPVPSGQEPEAGPGGERSGGRACIDARTAVQISGQELEEGDASRLASGQCDLELGGGQVCWHCREVQPEPTPSPAPTARVDKGPRCIDYLTPEAIGHEAWERYGIADKLQSHRFQERMCKSADCIICYCGRIIDEAVVYGDELYYRFDIESGELLMERIHWREDLPDHLPSPLINQQEAEAMVDGEVDSSHLAILSPDHMLFESTEPSFQDPCWFVSSTDKGEINIPRVTVINAMTGEVLGHYCPC